MSLLVVGSIALDSIETPFGKVERVLGGSASYFSLSASLFTDVHMVAVVGSKDFPREHIDLFKSKNIDTEGIVEEDGETFRWEGRYGYDLGDPQTLGTYLNVFENFDPIIPESYKEAEYVFLANIDPEIQLKVLKQVRKPKLVACDTMNFWIENKPKELSETLKHVDILIINDSETRELAQEPFIMKAARKILDMGPKMLVCKRGEYGALMFMENDIFFAPSYPLEEVFDPTGAGDTFAGGFMGYLSGNGTVNSGDFRKAVVYGSVLASFTVEDFGVERLRKVKKEDIEKRFADFLKLSRI